MASPFAAMAQRALRARRWLLLGNAGPALARFAPDDLATPDASGDSAAAVQAWAFWRKAALIEEALADLRQVRVARHHQSMDVPQALGELGIEPDAETAKELVQALSRVLTTPAQRLGSAWAQVVELSAEQGAPRLVDEGDRAAAGRLLAITEEPVRDVLTWATRRLGRTRRVRLALPDVLRALRNPTLDEVFRPAEDPWPALGCWRAALGLELGADAETADSPHAWFGSWALRGQERRVVGTAGWPGALRLRFALQGLGRLDLLAEAGTAALLPGHRGSAQLMPALYPTFLAERGFQQRALGFTAASADSARLAALGELLLQRTQAAIVQVWAIFEQTREVAAVFESAARFSAALYAPVPPALAMLLASPWSANLAAWPVTSLAAAALVNQLREAFDQDHWRNPRCVPVLRELASRSGNEPLTALVPGELASHERHYARWVEESLGA